MSKIEIDTELYDDFRKMVFEAISHSRNANFFPWPVFILGMVLIVLVIAFPNTRYSYVIQISAGIFFFILIGQIHYRINRVVEFLDKLLVKKIDTG